MNSTHNKLIRDGKVAVLYSPNYGIGWSTVNGKNGALMTFDADIVQAVLDNDRAKAAEIAITKLEGQYVCVLGADHLQVQWLPVGTVFEITEYDGAEGVRVIDMSDFMVA